MQGLTLAERICLPAARDRRSRRLAPAVVPLEDRRLLSGSSSAVMTQTATFPNIELAPKASSQAILYFSPTMGTLTEVDLVTSGSIGAGFQAENLGTTTTSIEGTVAGKISINAPTGEIPVTIPSLHWAFDAPAFDGTLDYGGISGKTIAPVTSDSTPQTTELTSPADLAAFTGHFRIPLSVSNDTTQSSAAADGKLSALFNTQTSATITVIYHFIPNLPSLDPAPGPISGQQSSTPPSSANIDGTSSTASSPPIATSSSVSPLPAGTYKAASNIIAAGSTKIVHHSGHPKKSVSVKKRLPLRAAIHPKQGRPPALASNRRGAAGAHEAHTG